MIDWNTVSLLGVDVGFSKTKKTTGIAIYANGELCGPYCVGSAESERREVIENYAPFDSIAVDGPLIPSSSNDPALRRYAESVLIGKGFYNRCKPGMSHYKLGLDLRDAAKQTADALIDSAKTPSRLFSKKQVRPGRCIVEAFPNAFLGVLLTDGDYESIGNTARGKKSDVFFRHALSNRRLDSLLEILELSQLRSHLELSANDSTVEGHEKRAALICLLTAACALVGKNEMVGEATGGWICLPPLETWQPWAIEALTGRKLAMSTHRHFRGSLNLSY